MPDCVTCGEDGPPSSHVMLTIEGCRKHGIRGMIALIKAGDRTPDDELIRRRCKCRPCPYRVRKGGLDTCKQDGLAAHYKTAVGSYTCEGWNE